MGSGYRYIIDVWQVPGDSLPEDVHELTDNPQISLYINGRYFFGILELNQPQPLTSLVNTFKQKLFHNTSYVPSGNPVPYCFQRQCISKIKDFVESIIQEAGKNNSNLRVIVGVMFEASRLGRYPRDYDISSKMVPASNASIDALETTVDVEDQQFCVICHEEFEMGNAKCMACKHVFHQDCIVPWLEKSHLCPLCSFAMPVDDDD